MRRAPEVETPAVRSPGLDGRHLRWLAVGLFVAATALAALTASDYGIASDEGNYFYHSLRMLSWWKDLAQAILAGEPSAALNREAIFEQWRWQPMRIPHPPLSRELGGISYVLLRGTVDPLTAYRGAVILAYGALVAGCGSLTAYGSRSLAAGLAAGAATLTVPALFAYAHLGLTDLFVTAFWFGSAASLFAYTETGRTPWLVSAGILFGAAASTKFSGILLVPALGVWLAIRGRRDVAPLLAILLLGAVTFFVANPVMWVDPIQGAWDYVKAGLFRSISVHIPTEYFGVLYPYRGPWHYPFVWTAIVTPIPLLAAAALGLSCRDGRRLVGLALVHLVVMYGAVSLPGAPLHDGIRLFLPVFPFLCVLAGLGTARLAQLFQDRAPAPLRERRGWIAAAALLVVFGLPALRTMQYHPYQLSYFNAWIGGIRGAHARGLEVTNMKEILNREVVADLRGIIPGGAVVDPGFFLEEVCFYQAVGWAPSDWHAESWVEGEDLGPDVGIGCEGPQSFLRTRLERRARDPDYVFVFSRRAQWRTLDWALDGYGERPAYVVAVDGVPLLRVYRAR